MLGINLADNEAPEPEDFPVLKSNWPVLNAFFALDGCAWQYTSMGHLIGLDYAAAHVIWNGLGITLSVEEFSGLMVFARTVADELNKKLSK